MSVMQKINLAALVLGLAALGYYLARIVPQFGGDVSVIAWQMPMAVSLSVCIVLIIVAGVIIAATDKDLRQSKDRIDDERDRAFERRGDAWAGHIVQGFVFVALILLMAGQPAFWVANALYAGVMLGGAAGLVIRLAGYKGA